ncbi:MAG: type II toxin-antitoxin system RelE/ParE family toxin [Verrucomicrobiae bacterium]|nr:type II toxin-antitoxin system RelE/ParE family toxin [Verrucomicrobiae bacterium]
MIETFADSETEKIYSGRRSRKLPEDIQIRVRRKLRMINQARSLQDLRIPPANRLEPLKGDWKGFWSIRVNQQWRVVFKWNDGHAREVSVVDYH